MCLYFVSVYIYMCIFACNWLCLICFCVFRGVPVIVDFAAMRDAVKRLGGDPQKINPICPADLVIDHSVQVDVSQRWVSDHSVQVDVSQSMWTKMGVPVVYFWEICWQFMDEFVVKQISYSFFSFTIALINCSVSFLSHQ